MDRIGFGGSSLAGDKEGFRIKIYYGRFKRGKGVNITKIVTTRKLLYDSISSIKGRKGGLCKLCH